MSKCMQVGQMEQIASGFVTVTTFAPDQAALAPLTDNEVLLESLSEKTKDVLQTLGKEYPEFSMWNRGRSLMTHRNFIGR